MRITRRILINSIAFLVLAAGLVLLLAVQVLPTVVESSYKIYGIFSAAGGVATNQEVTYRGVQVGRVGKMTLTPHAVKIELVIQSGFKIPKQGTRARVLFKSAVGEQFVDLTPVRESAPYFRSGDVIPESMTSIPIQIESLLRELDGVLKSIDPKALGTLIHELGTGLTGHGQDLANIIKGFDVLTKIGATHTADITGILHNGADVQQAFDQSSDDFVRAIGSLRTVVATLATHKDDLSRVLSGTRDLDTQIVALLDSRRQQLNRIIHDLGNVTRLTDARLGDVDRVLTYLGPFLADVASTFDSPYFNFNLVVNLENPACVYSDPSGRPVRPVTDASKKPTPTQFRCPLDASAIAAGGITSLPPELRIQLERISWLQLFTLGY